MTIHPGEAVEEKVSLSERFGLWISFYPFTQDEYLDIVAHWLQHFGVAADDLAGAERDALNWALQRVAQRPRGVAVRQGLGRQPFEKKRASGPITLVSAAVLLRGANEFLLARRPEGKVYAGWWEFPGGKVEAGETFHDALVRELHEEMGISITAATPWLTREFRYPHATVRIRFFRVTAWEGISTRTSMTRLPGCAAMITRKGDPPSNRSCRPTDRSSRVSLPTTRTDERRGKWHRSRTGDSTRHSRAGCASCRSATSGCRRTTGHFCRRGGRPRPRTRRHRRRQ